MQFPKSAGYSSVFKTYRFKICRQKMCRFRVNGRPIRHISLRFHNVLTSCDCSLSEASFEQKYSQILVPATFSSENKFWNVKDLSQRVQ